MPEQTYEELVVVVVLFSVLLTLLLLLLLLLMLLLPLVLVLVPMVLSMMALSSQKLLPRQGSSARPRPPHPRLSSTPPSVPRRWKLPLLLLPAVRV